LLNNDDYYNKCHPTEFNGKKYDYEEGNTMPEAPLYEKVNKFKSVDELTLITSNTNSDFTVMADVIDHYNGDLNKNDLKSFKFEMYQERFAGWAQKCEYENKVTSSDMFDKLLPKMKFLSEASVSVYNFTWALVSF